MRIAGTLRIISAVVVLLCLFLPVTKCNQFLSGTTTYEYSWEQVSIEDVGSWVLVLIYFWPAAILLIRRSILTRVLEPLLAAGSAYILHLQTLFTSGFAIGGLVAFWSLVCFGVASLVESTFEAAHRHRPRWNRV